MTSQDLKKGIDFTAAELFDASSWNQVVDAGRVADDKGLILESTDTALDTPDVPNPDVELEGVTPTWWTRYRWRRLGFPSSGVAPKNYHWNPEAEEDATFLKWQLEVDLEEIEERLDEIEADVLTANTTANSANSSAVVASNNATAALIAASAAQTSVDALTGRVTTAEAEIDELQEAIEELGGNDSAIRSVETGGTGAATPNGARLNLGLEFAPRGFAILRDSKAAGTPGGTFTSGDWRDRDLTEISAIGTHGVTLNEDNTFTLTAGVYLIEGSAPACDVDSHQARVYNTSGVAEVVGLGSSEFVDSTDADSQTRSHFYVFYTVTSTAILKIQHRCVSTSSGTTGFGRPAVSFGNNEIYTIVKITRMK